MSADAGNRATLGTDSLIFVPPLPPVATFARWAWGGNNSAADPGAGNLAISGTGNQPRVFAISKTDYDALVRNFGLLMPGDNITLTDDPDAPPVSGFARYVVTATVVDNGTWVQINADRTDTSGSTASPPLGTVLRLYLNFSAGGGASDDFVLRTGDTMTGPLVIDPGSSASAPLLIPGEGDPDQGAAAFITNDGLVSARQGFLANRWTGDPIIPHPIRVSRDALDTTFQVTADGFVDAAGRVQTPAVFIVPDNPTTPSFLLDEFATLLFLGRHPDSLGIAVDSAGVPYRHGPVSGDFWRLLDERDLPGTVADTGWLNCPINSPWVVAGGQTPQMRQIGNQVYCRGMLSNPAVVTSTAQVMTVPVGIDVPGNGYTAHFAGNANTTAILNRFLEVRSNRGIWGYSANGSAAWWPFTGMYLTD